MTEATNYFRAVALDYDGTISHGPRPEPQMLNAIARVRGSSRKVLLVTGRIMSELRADFPDVDTHFDSVVAENGAVIWHDGREHLTAAPVSDKLRAQLNARRVPVRSGSVILATDAHYDAIVRDACVSLGLDEQLVRNRAALMVLPAGVSKAFGLLEALAQLGISAHNTVGVGDAENDLALLHACEVGVAVSNAVDSLKEHADFVLTGPGPTALAQFLEHDLLAGLPQVLPRRRRIDLGSASDGSRVTIPASRIQVFIDGPTGSGKSYVAGLLAEELMHAGYTVCMLDLEGDHGELGRLRGALTLGGHEPLPTAEEVSRIVCHRFSSLVLDLSLREPALKSAYARDVLERLAEVRREFGLPHWIIIEEAHMVPSELLDRARACGSVCLVTYHPDWLPQAAIHASDVLITLEAGGTALLRTSGSTPIRFRPRAREIRHVRHQRKYASGQVPYERGFTFRDSSGAIGPHAGSMSEFAIQVQEAAPKVLVHHATRHDFSRWIRDVFQDKHLATAVRRAEDELRPDAVDLFRNALLAMVGLRYDLDWDAT